MPTGTDDDAYAFSAHGSAAEIARNERRVRDMGEMILSTVFYLL